MDTNTLAEREQRAQTGVLQFAEEMQAIRDEKLYPNAGKKDAWKTYCKERWGTTSRSVETTIAAAPVIVRRSLASSGPVAMTAAAEVATLPEAVQDAILEDTPKRDTVRARAKAARREQKKAEKHGVAADSDEMIAAAMAAKPPKKIKPPVVPDEFRDENLPPKLTPEDHGWLPRRLAGDAVLALWRANQKMQDETPPDADDREATEAKLETAITLAETMLSGLRGEGFISDEDLHELIEEGAR